MPVVTSLESTGSVGNVEGISRIGSIDNDLERSVIEKKSSKAILL